MLAFSILRTTILKGLILSFQIHPSGCKMHHQCCRMFQNFSKLELLSLISNVHAAHTTFIWQFILSKSYEF